MLGGVLGGVPGAGGVEGDDGGVVGDDGGVVDGLGVRLVVSGGVLGVLGVLGVVLGVGLGVEVVSGVAGVAGGVAVVSGRVIVLSRVIELSRIIVLESRIIELLESRIMLLESRIMLLESRIIDELSALGLGVAGAAALESTAGVALVDGDVVVAWPSRAAAFWLRTSPLAVTVMSPFSTANTCRVPARVIPNSLPARETAARVAAVIRPLRGPL